MNLSDINIVNIKGFGYRCIISGISKNKAINLMENANLTELTNNNNTKIYSHI